MAALSFGFGATCGGNGLCMRTYSKFCDFFHVFCIISYSVFFIWFSLKTIWSYLYSLSLYYSAFFALISDFHNRPLYRICNVVCCYFSLLCSCFSIGMSLKQILLCRTSESPATPQFGLKSEFFLHVVPTQPCNMIPAAAAVFIPLSPSPLGGRERT